jgi:hypothetical protein
MTDQVPLLSNGLVDDEQDEWSTGPGIAASAPLPTPPATRDEVLARVGPVKRAVYVLVRQCVDDFEKAAPWELLYYPPDDPGALLAMVGSLVTAIKVVPKKVDVLLKKLPAGESGNEPTREDIGFLLHGIHRMVAHDIKRLEGILAPVRDRGLDAPPTLDERQSLCELSADLKGKYASALMGAAASLIGEGQWNGVELEPVLFPEKAEEFRCTRELIVSLREAVAAIRQLPEQIPFPQIVERWRGGARVDQYALADLPSLRGRISRLLKERSRRALYSGDYYQISRREVLLSQRINELERLHQQTWAVHPPGSGEAPDLGPVYARLVQLTLEMAAVLDANILKTLIGEKKVNGLRGRMAAGGAAGKPAGDGLDALMPLLAEDDLRIFFEMLLTAVQRRASLSVQEPAPVVEAPAVSPSRKNELGNQVESHPEGESRAGRIRAGERPALPDPSARPSLQDDSERSARAQTPPPPAPPRPAPPPPMSEPPIYTVDELLTPLPDFPEAEPRPRPLTAPRAPERSADPLQAMARVRVKLDEIQAPTNSHWNNFRLTQRMLEKHSRLPGAMFHSIDPFLQEIADHLVPDLKLIAPHKGLTPEAVQRLETVCRELCSTDPSPADMVSEVPRKLERILRFLDALRAVLPPAAGTAGG